MSASRRVTAPVFLRLCSTHTAAREPKCEYSAGGGGHLCALYLLTKLDYKEHVRTMMAGVFSFVCVWRGGGASWLC